MDIIAENGGKIFGAVTIKKPSDFTPPFSGYLYPCLIWDHGSSFDEKDRSVIAKALIVSGCRYAVCGGETCEKWHDTVDYEFVKIQINDSEEVQDKSLVMTSWHEGESIDDVAFFFVLNTNFDYHDFRRYLILHVGASEASKDVNDSIRKYTLTKPRTS